LFKDFVEAQLIVFGIISLHRILKLVRFS